MEMRTLHHSCDNECCHIFFFFRDLCEYYQGQREIVSCWGVMGGSHRHKTNFSSVTTPFLELFMSATARNRDHSENLSRFTSQLCPRRESRAQSIYLTENQHQPTEGELFSHKLLHFSSVSSPHKESGNVFSCLLPRTPTISGKNQHTPSHSRI